jgi:YidC/Oxa1 family membrane protein insertase
MKFDNARNTVIFVICTVVILILYQVFVLQPQANARKAAQLAEHSQTLKPGAARHRAPDDPHQRQSS